jgi:hypothetical protein
MRLIKSAQYPLDTMHLVGWRRADGSTATDDETAGYSLWAYFYVDTQTAKFGVYTGPDEYGIEPIVEIEGE